MPDVPSDEQKMEYSLTALMNHRGASSGNSGEPGFDITDRLLLSALERCESDPVYGVESGRIRGHVERAVSSRRGADERQNLSGWAQDTMNRAFLQSGGYALSFGLSPASHLYGAVGLWERNQSDATRQRIARQWQDVNTTRDLLRCTFSDALHIVCPEFPPDSTPSGLTRPTAEQKLQYSLTALMNYQGADSRNLNELGGEFSDRLVVAALARCAENPDYGPECGRVKNHIEGLISSQAGAAEAQSWSEWTQDKLSGAISEAGSYALSFELDPASQLYGAVGLWERKQPSAVRRQIAQQWEDVQTHQARSQCTFSEALQRVSPDFPPHLADSNDVSVASAAHSSFPQVSPRPDTPPPAYSPDQVPTRTRGASHAR